MNYQIFIYQRYGGRWVWSAYTLDQRFSVVGNGYWNRGAARRAAVRSAKRLWPRGKEVK